MVKTTFSVVVAAVAALGMFVVGASPANAVTPTLPSDQHMFIVDCDNGDGYLWSVDPTTGMSTAVGSANPTHQCTGGVQQNPVDGKVYVIWDDRSANQLSTVNTETGVYTDIGEIHGASTFISALIITNSGDAYGASFGGGPLFRVDLSSGLTTLIGSPGINTAVVAYNPADDTIYAYTWGGDAYRINNETGAATALPDHNVELTSPFNCADGTPQTTTNVYGGAFDSRGNAWLMSDNCNQLLAVDFSTGSATGMGYFQDSSQSIKDAPYFDVYTDASLFITTDNAGSGTGGDAEALAKTGGNAGFGLGYVSLSAVVLAAGVMLRRRRAHN
jgi:LPXTG-motif cell wall-anchored protein